MHKKILVAMEKNQFEPFDFTNKKDAMRKLGKNSGNSVFQYALQSLLTNPLNEIDINTKYDLSKLNIVGICDRSFSQEDEEKQFLGYNKILIENICECDADVILTGVPEYFAIIDYLKKDIFKTRKIMIRPLAYIPIGMFLRRIIFGQDKDLMR